MYFHACLQVPKPSGSMGRGKDYDNGASAHSGAASGGVHADRVRRPANITAKRSPSNPAGLTSREVEVLRLVARGPTDIQVAEQLIISPRTVNTHLTSIFNKLGVDSRTSATRFAVDHRLV